MAKTRKSNKQKTKQNYNADIKGIIIIAISLIIALGIYTDSVGYLGYLSKKVFISLFGVGAYILPIYIIYLSINYIVNKGTILFNKVLLGLSLIIINTLLFIQALNMETYYYDNITFATSINLIIDSKSVFHAGIIGFSIALPIYKLIGAIGSYILYIAMYFISSIILFNFTLEDFGLKLRGLKGLKPATKSKAGDEKVKAEDGYLSLKEATDGEKEHKSLIGDIDDKIKILDFMKNNTVKEEIATDRHLENVKIVTSDDNKPHAKEKKGLDNEVKETVSKEIEDVLSEKSGNIQYTHPNIDLLNLNSGSKMNKEDKKDLIANASKLEETLGSFGVDAKVVQVTKGPSVTRFELQPSPGVKVSKIVNLSDDIALGLAASGVRIEAPIPGKAAVGIEVPNKEQTPVFLREVLDSDEFKNKNGNVSFALGKDIAGKCVATDLSKMPHLLIAGATGSGKSVCINALIISILYKYSPDDVKLLMVDPKVVELNVYNGIPHLLIPVVTDPKKAAAALNWAVNEMTRRYKLFADNGVRNIESYNGLHSKGIVDEKLPFIVIIVDELADLMMVCPNDVEDYIARLAQMARAAGMHLVIATQRPSVDVITGVIKANIPSRISFAVSSQIDSRTILDSSGAEKLLGRGDMLFYPVGEPKPVRIQGAFITEEEVEQVVNFIKDGEKIQPNEYENEILQHINSEVKTTTQDKDVDELLDEAIKIVIESGQASTSYLQRRLRIGFNRAARIMDQLEENNIISQRDGSKPRQVLVSKEDMENMN